MKLIPYTKPSISELEVSYVTDAIKNGWGESCYEYINRFERAFCEHLGVKHAIATSSATGALHMGLAAINIRDGDEIIIADINWIATVAPVTYMGATPVFVDVLSDSWCISPKSVEEAITKKTKAIIATHLYGNLCNMAELLAIGERYGIPVIEDSAEAIGAVYYGKRAGSMGLFSVFSFHGTKTITTGEGGMFVTNDTDLYNKVLTLSNHGRSKTQEKQFWPDVIGFKYKMSNVQAAIGCAQLERIQELVAGKRRVFERYKEALKNSPVSMNPEPKGLINGYWMPTIIINKDVKFDRDKLLDDLRENNIDGRIFFWPLSQLPMFINKNNKVSCNIYSRGVNLPSYVTMTQSEIDQVVQIVKKHI